jgi:cytosine/adenosine deaminase-related metal-dependent hydrolase
MRERVTRTFSLRTADGRHLRIDAAQIGNGSAAGGPTFDVGAGELRPGLINAHDHLQLNHYPRLGDPPYADAYDWGRDIHDRYADAIARAGRLPRRDAFLFGALKNLMSGVTTVVHHDPWDDVLDAGFPIRVAPVRVVHSLGFERDLPNAMRGNGRTAARPISMHLAEGTNQAAADEIRECERHGLLDDLLAVHVVGVDPDGIRRLRAAGAAVIACPTSNRFLLARTPPPGLFHSGIDVLLGSDALLTADGTLLDEARTAIRLGLLSKAGVERAVGATAARRLKLAARDLGPGADADIVVLRRPLGEATPRDVALVLVQGLPVFGDDVLAELFVYCGVETERLTVGSIAKVVVAPLASIAHRVVDLTPEVGRVFD